MMRFLNPWAIIRLCQRLLYSYKRSYHIVLILLLCLALSSVLSLGKLAPAYSQTAFKDFSDIQGHWAQPCIQQLAQRRVLSGYPDGTFRPNAAVTRAEFAAIIKNAFPKTPIVRSGGSFVDVSPGYWANNQIRYAYQTQFLSGYPNNIFRPTQNIPRVQVLVALASGLNYSPSLPVDTTLSQVFNDAIAIPHYAKNTVAAATEKGLVVNYPQVRQLKPNDFATRAEVSAFVCQALNLDQVIASQYIATPITEELRGVWLTNIDSDVLFSPSKLAKAITKLDELNFNTLYPTVWNNGYTLYPSTVAEATTGVKLDPEPGLQRRDLIQEVINLGHQKEMAVIPWFEFGFMAPADSQLAKLHPDWLVQRLDGSNIWLEGGVLQRVWLNPLHPEVQKFITDLVVEIVTNYDVDGIQFDDHFGYPSDFGYDDFTVELYQQEHAGQRPPADYEDEEWIRWRADKITAYIRQLFSAIKESKPRAIVSLSPNPQDFSLEAYLLDWQTWERAGLIEELLIQVYRDGSDEFQSALKHPAVTTAKKHIPVGIGILAGIKPRQVPWSQVETQVQQVRNQDLAGVSFFFYETLWNLAPEPISLRQSGIRRIFPTAVERPSIYQ